MKNWAVALQQQCADLGERYLEVDRRLANLSVWNPVFHGREEQFYSNEDVMAFSGIIDEGFAVLAEVQKRLVDDPDSALPPVGESPVNQELQGWEIGRLTRETNNGPGFPERMGRYMDGRPGSFRLAWHGSQGLWSMGKQYI